MEQSNSSFMNEVLGIIAKAELAKENQNTIKTFDWDKAAEIIREKLKLHPDLEAEAGLKGDWDHNGGTIFINGKPTNKYCSSYLYSSWAKPTLILKWDGKEQEEWECSIIDNGDNERFEWDEKSLAILGIGL